MNCGYFQQVAVRGHLTTLELLSKAFELKHDGNDYFLPLIDPLMKSQKYKEVCLNEQNTVSVIQSFFIKSNIIHNPMLIEQKLTF